MSDSQTKNVIIRLKMDADRSVQGELDKVGEHAQKASNGITRLKESVDKIQAPVRITNLTVGDMLSRIQKDSVQAQYKVEQLSKAFERFGVSVEQARRNAAAFGKQFNMTAQQVEQAARMAQGPSLGDRLGIGSLGRLGGVAGSTAALGLQAMRIYGESREFYYGPGGEKEQHEHPNRFTPEEELENQRKRYRFFGRQIAGNIPFIRDIAENAAESIPMAAEGAFGNTLYDERERKRAAAIMAQRRMEAHERERMKQEFREPSDLLEMQNRIRLSDLRAEAGFDKRVLDIAKPIEDASRQTIHQQMVAAAAQRHLFWRPQEQFGLKQEEMGLLQLARSQARSQATAEAEHERASGHLNSLRGEDAKYRNELRSLQTQKQTEASYERQYELTKLIHDLKPDIAAAEERELQTQQNIFRTNRQNLEQMRETYRTLGQHYRTVQAAEKERVLGAKEAFGLMSPGEQMNRLQLVKRLRWAVDHPGEVAPGQPDRMVHGANGFRFIPGTSGPFTLEMLQRAMADPGARELAQRYMADRADRNPLWKEYLAATGIERKGQEAAERAGKFESESAGIEGKIRDLAGDQAAKLGDVITRYVQVAMAQALVDLKAHLEAHRERDKMMQHEGAIAALHGGGAGF